MKITNGTIWVDNSNLKAMVVGDLVYCGTSVLYYTDLSGKTVHLKSFNYDPERSDTFPEADIESFLELDLELDYLPDEDVEQLICVEPYWRLIIENQEIVRQQQLVETKTACTCQCGKPVFHINKPIPPITPSITDSTSKTDELPED